MRWAAGVGALLAVLAGGAILIAVIAILPQTGGAPSAGTTWIG